MLLVILTPVICSRATIHKLPACPLVCFRYVGQGVWHVLSWNWEKNQECGEYFVLGVQSLSNEALLAKCIIYDSRL